MQPTAQAVGAKREMTKPRRGGRRVLTHTLKRCATQNLTFSATCEGAMITQYLLYAFTTGC